MQKLPLTANIITFFSFLLALAAIPFLFINLKPIFILLMIFSYTFDNIDGIWARMKNQTSEFGTFFDPFLDKAKDFVADLAFIIFYLSSISAYAQDSKIILLAVSTYFMLKGLFYMARDCSFKKQGFSTLENRKVELLRYGGAEKFMIVYPLLAYSFPLFAVYIIGYFFLYLSGILLNIYKIKKL
ncbi:MAG: CDP-alcohol phosphatidyltransferase family protein [Candidatus Omnitrophota bacterium]